MKKSVSGGLALISVLAAAAVVFSQLSANVEAARREALPVLVCGTDQVEGSDEDGCFSTCGGEIPWPFQTSNQVVELADGERYVLMGEVVYLRGIPYLIVDLDAHPWLATARRRQDPSYPLMGSGAYWKQYVGRRIQLRAVARWVVSAGGEVSVLLESLTDPAVVSTSTMKSDAGRSKR
jgi:hypothetical protein